MKIILDIEKYHKKIKNSIRKYGHCAEHNYMHYLFMQNSLEKNVAFDFGEGRFVLANVDKRNRWELFPSGILAPESERFTLFKKVLDYVLIKKKAEKIVVEFDEKQRKEILHKFKFEKKYKVRSPLILYWPVYKMENWDIKLKGKKWKKLRNIKNRFNKQHKVKAIKSTTINKEKLKQIITSWLKRRNNTDRVDKNYYNNIVDNGFKGFDFTRTLLINGKPCTITAGWKIPNGNGYYSSIGIFDYSYKELGDIANIDDLNNLKKQGIEYVDFGGSDKSLLAFKKKFKPDFIYKTYIFSIVRG